MITGRPVGAWGTAVLRAFLSAAVGTAAFAVVPASAEPVPPLAKPEAKPADAKPADAKSAEPLFVGAGPWFNSQPLTAADLQGKVVLVDFWCYTCVNCIRTLPYINEWHDRYAKHGLVIVGVHAPEFDFERTPANVKAAVEKFKLKHPIVLDNDRAIWEAFHNRFWPAKYAFADGKDLLDERGRLDGAETRAKFSHFGEGEYAETERKIQALLRAKGVKAEFPEPVKPLTPLDAISERGGVCYPVTAELYANFRGFHQGQWGSLIRPEQAHNYRGFERMFIDDIDRPIEGKAYLRGTWQVSEEYTRHARATKDYTDSILIRYKAVEVNAVIHLHSREGEHPKPVLVKVTLDGKPLPKEKAGADVVFEGGESFLKVSEPRMYRIVSSPEWGVHDLALWPRDDGFALYAYTFGSCLKPGVKPPAEK
jgi:thiol-disulfide isomerase/thioredoxin